MTAWCWTPVQRTSDQYRLDRTKVLISIYTHFLFWSKAKITVMVMMINGTQNTLFLIILIPLHYFTAHPELKNQLDKVIHSPTVTQINNTHQYTLK